MTERNKKIRIRLYGQHLAYINSFLYYSFVQKCEVLDYSSWIKKMAKKEFDILITGEDSIEELKTKVINSYFEDIGDWLRQRMREKMLEK